MALSVEEIRGIFETITEDANLLDEFEDLIEEALKDSPRLRNRIKDIVARP